MLDMDYITIIAIARRLSTIKHIDRIMDKSRFVEDVTFTELVRKDKDKFRELWERIRLTDLFDSYFN